MNKTIIKDKVGNFEEEVLKCLFQKYGLFPDNYIISLLEEELGIIRRRKREEEIIILYDFINWLKKERIPYWLRGTAGSSLLFYILGITRGNPLPAHSLCPECKKTDWLDHNYHSGYDIKDVLKCEKDGQSLLTDGHNIPWQGLWGYTDKEIIFTIDMPKEFYDKVEIYWQVYQEQILEEDILKIRKELENFRFLNIDCIFIVEQTNTDFYKTKVDIDKAVESFDLGELPSPYSFSDLLYGLGLEHSTGAWTEKTRFMVENLGMNLSDMIAFREDIYFYLLKHHYCEEDAWLGLESFRRPNPSFEVTEEMQLTPDKWKIAICQDIQYLFPKAHCLEELIFRMKNQVQEG